MGINLNPEHRNFGQTTGGTHDDNEREARTIIGLIRNVTIPEIEDACGGQSANFINGMRVYLARTHPSTVTGKQLFWLRDVKDKLIETGRV